LTNKWLILKVWFKHYTPIRLFERLIKYIESNNVRHHSTKPREKESSTSTLPLQLRRTKLKETKFKSTQMTKMTRCIRQLSFDKRQWFYAIITRQITNLILSKIQEMELHTLFSKIFIHNFTYLYQKNIIESNDEFFLLNKNKIIWFYLIKMFVLSVT